MGPARRLLNDPYARLAAGAGIAVALLAVLAALIGEARRPDPGAAPDAALPAEVEGLSGIFVARGYTLDRVRGGEEAVPRLFLARLPSDLPRLEAPGFRKTVFIEMILPLLLAENERILADRSRLERLVGWLEAGLSVPENERQWLDDLAWRYGVGEGAVGELVRRIDAVPPSLAIAQAALETGWGTSPAAQRHHAMFGEMVFRGTGEGAAAELRKFDRLAGAVAAYARNLNTHKAYARFRAKRAELRREDRSPDGLALAPHLHAYSERRLEYVRTVAGIIRKNNLRPLDTARLGS
ncbi:MAG: glucosaminidase domain-containing protein [Pseudomonadota bacterium]